MKSTMANLWHPVRGVQIRDLGEKRFKLGSIFARSITCQEASRPVTMKILSWNVRGLERPRTIRRLRYLLKAYNPHIVFFMETKLGSRQMEWVCRKCGFVHGVEVDLEGFYGPPYAQDRNESCDVLKSLSTADGIPWFVCSDFNEIIYGSEKKGGLPRDKRRMDLFRRTLEECQLIDVGYSGRWFTWERGNLPKMNIRERLDRGVANARWVSMFPEVKVQHLVHSFSDHCHLLINTSIEGGRLKNKTFKFEAWWSLEESFLNEVNRIWKMSSRDLMQKLENLKKGLDKWAGQIQMNRKKRKQALTAKLSKLYEGDRDDNNLAELIDTKIHLNFEIEKDECYWKQRARLNWLKFGDKNTTFFHSQATQRKKKISFVSIGRCILDEDNKQLTVKYTREEIQAVVFEMGSTKALGEDGLSGLFYQKCWHIIGDEVTGFYLQLLNGDMEVSSINSSNIVLISKNSSPSNMTHYRPISLCNVLYKILAKAIANRFRKVIGKCIDAAQSAFVPGRLISDNMLLAYEILNTLKQKRMGKKWFIAVKLYMSKCVNFDKSMVFFSKNTLEEDKQVVVNLLGVCSSSEPERYLAKGLLQKGLCWQIVRGNKVSIWNDCWIQGIESLERHNSSDNMQLELVSDLIDYANRKWRADMISNTFHPDVARTILQISLSESDHEDFQV
ncbi:reverse transcriptase [Gossypium australe]|uniref:Reverse transcriptase n=1 Tax=Gossypium australe TaxID=47621 RepID=A0A5B6UW04_9ROSI|nr:reverse transcriptase [Gossypium australe]